MKKIATLFLCMILALACIITTSCGGNKSESVDLSNSKYVGTWKFSAMNLKDESTGDVEMWELTLNADGTGVFVDAEGTNEVTWEQVENGFKTKGDVKLTFTDDGDKIKTKVLGVDLIFEKQS